MLRLCIPSKHWSPCRVLEKCFLLLELRISEGCTHPISGVCSTAVLVIHSSALSPAKALVQEVTGRLVHPLALGLKNLPYALWAGSGAEITMYKMLAVPLGGNQVQRLE